jgi:metal-responsive CopG/Arc/MetJ family transcriptional regulator
LSYTRSMKTAVSLPGDVFERAERFARRTKRTRSRLFADALGEYLARHDGDEVTAAMNAVVAEVEEAQDPFTRNAAIRRLRRAEW